MVDERLLTASGHVEDAAAYLLDAERVLLFTTDFFTPIVDDPYLFGQIAAANAFSDIYAMGGRPTLALNLAAFPTRTHRLEELSRILQGGADKALEAGCLVAGGHTIDDPEPKYGMAVVGEVHPSRLLRKGGARPGDLILLTKPLGTGILATAFKEGDIGEAGMAQAVESMRTLNRAASEAAAQAGAAGATDVTGFGLLGHLLEMCEESGASASLLWSSLPFFEGTEAQALEDNVPGGTRSNLAAVEGRLQADPAIPRHRLLMAADAQTSGGLLVALDPGRESLFREALEGRGGRCWTLGRFGAGPARIHLAP
jgi:selenide,water dikinase